MQGSPGFADAIEKKKPDALFHADSASAYSAIVKNLSYPLIGTLVFFPGTNVRAEFDQLTRAFFFKFRTHPGNLATRRNHESEHAFAGAPLHASEIEHAGARLEINRLNAILAH